jgi:spermidine synthase
MAGEIPALGAFFLSGAAALVFEVAWFHRAGLVFGNSLWAVTIVLSAFMGGLAIGNALVARYAARIRHPLALYALLELAVGGFGIAAVYVLPTLTGIVVPTAHLLPEGSLALNATRLITAFAVLVVPATAMGATLPVLAGAVGRTRSFGGVLGRLYGFNTLGAVAGVIVSEVWFVRLVGVAGAAWLAASLNVAAAAIVFWLSARSSHALHAGPDRLRQGYGESAEASAKAEGPPYVMSRLIN